MTALLLRNVKIEKLADHRYINLVVNIFPL